MKRNKASSCLWIGSPEGEAKEKKREKEERLEVGGMLTGSKKFEEYWGGGWGWGGPSISVSGYTIAVLQVMSVQTTFKIKRKECSNDILVLYIPQMYLLRLLNIILCVCVII